ncbi:MAG: hypothetical protein AB7N73_14490 [Gemmatimonadales bacterium]
MPFVARTLVQHTGPGAGIIRTPWRGHVAEGEVEDTDQVVEPTPEELEGLRAQYPEEYGENDPPFSFAEANAADAIAAIAGAEDLEQLAEWLEIELAGGKRKTVLAAFAEKGLTTGDGG